MPATSSAGRTGRWRCAGAPRGWSRPASSSAASTATCTCRPCAPHWRLRLPGLSPARARIRRCKRPDDHRGRHRSSTELGTSSADRRERFPESEQRWAAVFDYLIQQGDRDGHNWLVYLDDEGQPHLKLTDHGYAFGAPGRPLRSTFYTEHRGLAFDAQMRAALRGLQDVRFAKDLETLLPRELISALLERVELLLN